MPHACLAMLDGSDVGAIIVIVVIALALAGRGQIGTPLVLKSWYANSTPMPDGSYICITGRRSGFVGWLFALLGIDPVTTLKVSATRIEFSAASLMGRAERITPLSSVSSSYFGFHKPLFAALFIGVFFGLLACGLFSAVLMVAFGPSLFAQLLSLMLGFATGLLLAFLYFKFNKTKTIGFVEVSGFACEIRFKPSVIEGVSIDEAQAKYAAELMQHLIQARLDR